MGILRRIVWPWRRWRRPMRVGGILLLIPGLLLTGLRLLAAPMAMPVFESIAESRVQRIVRLQAAELMEKGKYGEFCTLHYGADGSVQGVAVDSLAAEAFATALTHELERELRHLRLSCRIRSGDLIFPRLFSGSGWKFTVRGSLYGGASARMCSSLEEGGLNQTLHRLELEVSVPCTLTVLGKERQLCIVTRILMGEAVIVGALVSLPRPGQGTGIE